MSEVKKQRAILPDGAFVKFEIVVSEADFDAQRLRADTAEAALVSANADKEAYAQNAIDLRKRAEAADTAEAELERAGMLIGELRELLNIVRDDTGEYYSENLQSRILAALNPEVESHE